MAGTDLETIVSSAYSAAIGEDGWQPWFEQFARSIGSVGGVFAVMNQRSRDIEYLLPLSDNPKGMEEYRDEMWRRDPYAGYLAERRSSDARLELVSNAIDRTDPATVGYMAWQEDRFDFHTTVMLGGNIAADRFAGFCLHFPRGEADRATETLHALADTYRPIVDAVRLGFRHQDLLRTAYWEGAVAGRDGCAAFLVGDRGNMLRLNDMAEALVRSEKHVIFRSGGLCCAAGAHGPLRRLIHDAVVGQRGGTVLLSGREGGAPLRASIHPLPKRDRSLLVEDAAALLLIEDTGRPRPPSADLWRALFGMTTAEARLADQLRDGATDQLLAARQGVAVSTIRSHLKSIHAKTETHGKAELVALLARLSAG